MKFNHNIGKKRKNIDLLKNKSYVFLKKFKHLAFIYY